MRVLSADSRRCLVVGLACLLAACATVPVPSADDGACTDTFDVPWQAVAPGVWIWLPPREAEVDERNGGHVAPTTAVIDDGEALVVDPGPSHRHGLRVRQSLRCRFGARAVWVVNTHAHAENVLGNSAFADAQARGEIRIAASGPTIGAMRRRCPDCLRSLVERVGAEAMAGTRIVWPDTEVSGGATLRVGSRTLHVLDVVQAHTEGDLLLRDASSGVLWAGGLVYGQRLPELAQGSLRGWLRALDRIGAWPVRHLIGATWSTAAGGVGAPPALAGTRQYLGQLHDGVWQAMDAGRLPQDAGLLPMAAYAGWAGYRERQAFNVMRAWRELEPLWMSGGSAPPSVAKDVGR